MLSGLAVRFLPCATSSYVCPGKTLILRHGEPFSAVLVQSKELYDAPFMIKWGEGDEVKDKKIVYTSFVFEASILAHLDRSTAGRVAGLARQGHAEVEKLKLSRGSEKL